MSRSPAMVDVPVPPISNSPAIYADLYLSAEGIYCGVDEPTVNSMLGAVVPMPNLSLVSSQNK